VVAFRTATSLLAVAALVVLAGFAPAILAGCRASDPPNRPVDLCVRSCAVKAVRQCSEDECTRGCQFILDRLAEKEGETVISCVAARETRCGDPVWADCATRVGVHIDGGPPAPPSTREEWE
jgi:hypothetical protein